MYEMLHLVFFSSAVNYNQ